MPKHSPEPLCPESRALELLGIQRGELVDLERDGKVRRVRLAGDDAGESYLLGHDIQRLLDENDPRHLARVAAGEAVDGDGEDPRSLAADLPRL